MQKVDLYRVAEDIRDACSNIKEYATRIDAAADQRSTDEDLLERLFDLGGSKLLDQIENFDGDLDEVLKQHKDLSAQGLDLDELIEAKENYDAIVSASVRGWSNDSSITDQIIAIIKADENKQAAAIERTKEILRQFALLLEETK